MIRIIVLVLIGISTGCTTIKINSSKMKQIFYTQEGTPYVLRVISNNSVNNVLVPPSNNELIEVIINNPSNVGINKINLNTSKRIIPLIANMSFVDHTTGVPSCDAVAIYYSVVVGKTPGPISQSFICMPAQLKLWPMADKIFLTNDNFYGFNLKYNQAVFNDSDFVDGLNSMELVFGNNRARSLNNQVAPAVILAGTYDVNINFLYFEML